MICILQRYSQYNLHESLRGKVQQKQHANEKVEVFVLFSKSCQDFLISPHYDRLIQKPLEGSMIFTSIISKKDIEKMIPFPKRQQNYNFAVCYDYNDNLLLIIEVATHVEMLPLKRTYYLYNICIITKQLRYSFIIQIIYTF